MAASIGMTNTGMAAFARLIGLGLSDSQFGAMAIGSNSGAANVLDQRLGNEFTTLGGGRIASATATKTLRDTGAVGFNNTMRFVGTWSFSGILQIREFTLANSDTADVTNSGNPQGGPPTAGTSAMRGVFNANFSTQAADVFTLTEDIVIDDKTVDIVGQPSQVIPSAGLTYILTLIQAGSTPTKFGFLAMGTGSTAAAVANTTLATEIAASGLSRAAATITNTTTVVTNDTTQFDKQFTVITADPTPLQETGIFTASSAGTMAARFVWANTLALIVTDVFQQRTKIVHVTS